MRKQTVRIGLFLIFLTFMSGFLFCPHMNSWRNSDGKQESAQIHQLSVNEAATTAAPLSDVSQAIIAENSLPTFVASEKLTALRVVSTEELKSQDYHTYIYRRYVERESGNGKVASKKESEQYVREQLGPKLISYLEASTSQ